VSAAKGTHPGHELFVRHARRDGRSIAVMRAVDYGESCVVEAEVFQSGSAHAVRPGPYTFGSAREATVFVTEAVEALMYLGCDVQAA
jgi:predicted nucleotidyltransferase